MRIPSRCEATRAWMQLRSINSNSSNKHDRPTIDREYRESPGVFEGGATQPAGMHRRPNANELRRRDTRTFPAGIVLKLCSTRTDKAPEQTRCHVKNRMDLR